jgi:hypothetical protein
MNKEIAKSMMAMAVSMDKEIGSMLDLIRQIEDDVTRSKFHQAVTDLMGHIAVDLIFQIERIYPDLNPELGDS